MLQFLINLYFIIFTSELHGAGKMVGQTFKVAGTDRDNHNAVHTAVQRHGNQQARDLFLWQHQFGHASLRATAV